MSGGICLFSWRNRGEERDVWDVRKKRRDRSIWERLRRLTMVGNFSSGAGPFEDLVRYYTVSRKFKYHRTRNGLGLQREPRPALQLPHTLQMQNILLHKPTEVSICRTAHKWIWKKYSVDKVISFLICILHLRPSIYHKDWWAGWLRIELQSFGKSSLILSKKRGESMDTHIDVFISSVTELRSRTIALNVFASRKNDEREIRTPAPKDQILILAP